MQYVSTRGNIEGIGFVDAFLMGLANDGGLIVPKQIPTVTKEQLQAWSKLSYTELVFELFKLFTNDEIPDIELKQLIDDSYSSFRHPEVTPVQKLTDELYLLELFHGPTFAFKDVALQFMGQFYSYVAKSRILKINILGATSGDTGASAIEGVKGKENINICILHPHGKVSKVQELQMTTVQDSNVLNLSVDGNFDDCQQIIKELFADLEFKKANDLAAINSINIVRIVAQIVYYFYAYFRVQEQVVAEKVNFSVPTGNFGDIFAGYMAKRMGLPVNKLILATNENNILERFIKEGVYMPGDFRMTHSPSMDIQVASNFERYLYYIYNEDAVFIEKKMQQFKVEGEISICSDSLAKVQSEFAAHGVNGDECLATIAKYKEQVHYLLDPHSACGVAAAEACAVAGEITVSLATAHPAKFNEAISLVGIEQDYPEQISSLFNKEQAQTRIAGNKQAIADAITAFYKARK